MWSALFSTSTNMNVGEAAPTLVPKAFLGLVTRTAANPDMGVIASR